MARKKSAPPESAPVAPEGGYTVLARRYRPQTFRELIGQEHVAQALENALKTNRVAHAYLFTGARGVGKTSTARVLAKALNCEKGPTATPCNECAMCRSIAAGEDVDVLEIDGASNRGIDNIREIRSNVQYRPANSRYKIYIIDEVHMLSKEAFNALLKTLEEPPPHIKFIFATTEVQKIPITILSRCQRFDFAGIGTNEIKDRLREIVQKEGKEADDEALEMVARRGAGSMRDAQSLLDQLLAFGGDRLTAEQIHSLLGTAGDDRVVELATVILERDPRRAVEILGKLTEKSLQLGELVDQLIAYWRDLMVVQVAGPEAPDLSVPSRYRDQLQKQAKDLPLDTIMAGLDVLSNTRMRLQKTNHGRLLVEMALIRLGRLDELASLGQLAQWLAKGGSLPATGNAVPAGAARPLSPPEAAKKKLSEDNGVDSSQVTALTADTLPLVWPRVLGQLGPLMASQYEKAGFPAISGPNALVLRFPQAYNKEREFAQAPERIQKLEDSVQKLTGTRWLVKVEAGVGEPGETQPTPVPATVTESPIARTFRQTEEAKQAPLIGRAIEALGAQVVRVDEGFNAAAATEQPATANTSDEASGEET